MRLAAFEHLEPKSLAEACALLAERGSGATVLAGGTDLLVRMKQGVAAPRCVVNVKRLPELGEIRGAGDELRLGAAVRLTDVQRSPLVRERCPVLAEAALGVGAAQLQNMGTIGGNLCLEPRCWYYQQAPVTRAARPPCRKIGGAVCYMAKGSKRCHALYSGDTAAALLALDARVRLVSSAGERTLALADFFVDDGEKHTVLGSGELLAEVIVPAKPGQSGAYLKYRKRGAVDFPIAGVAATIALDGRVCRDLRIAVTGAGSEPFLVPEARELAVGKELTPDLVDALAEAARARAKPVSQMEVSAPYRRRLVRVLTKDVLGRLLP